jgi:hypothetical protein
MAVPSRRVPSRLRLATVVAGLVALLGAVAAIAMAGGGGDDALPAPPTAAVLEREAAAARRPDPAVPEARTRRFDAAAALRLVRDQVAEGQRPSGSARLARVRARLVRRLPLGRTEPVAGHPGLRNVVGRMPARGSGRGRPAIVLAAHYDTQLAPRGFVGANDSAAGTAVVVEAARALLAADRRERRRAARDGEPAPSRREVRFVLLDGEELPPGGSEARFEQDGLRGSTAYAAAHAGQLGAVAVVDYVAGRGLRLPREGQSDPALWRRVRAAAARVGVARAFPDATGPTIIDDHVPFLRRGVPAVDLIDWSYPYKQGLDDRLRRLSERAIDATGETMVDWLIAERRR